MNPAIQHIIERASGLKRISKSELKRIIQDCNHSGSYVVSMLDHHGRNVFYGSRGSDMVWSTDTTEALTFQRREDVHAVIVAMQWSTNVFPYCLTSKDYA